MSWPRPTTPVVVILVLRGKLGSNGRPRNASHSNGASTRVPSSFGLFAIKAQLRSALGFHRRLLPFRSPCPLNSDVSTHSCVSEARMLIVSKWFATPAVVYQSLHAGNSSTADRHGPWRRPRGEETDQGRAGSPVGGQGVAGKRSRLQGDSHQGGRASKFSRRVAAATPNPTRSLTQRPLLNRERESFGESGGQGWVVASAAGVGRELSPRAPPVASPFATRGKTKTPRAETLGVGR